MLKYLYSWEKLFCSLEIAKTHFFRCTFFWIFYNCSNAFKLKKRVNIFSWISRHKKTKILPIFIFYILYFIIFIFYNATKTIHYSAEYFSAYRIQNFYKFVLLMSPKHVYWLVQNILTDESKNNLFLIWHVDKAVKIHS